MFFPYRIRLKPLAALCHRLAVATGAGLDDRRIWRDEAERGSGAQRAAIGQIRDALARGASIEDALKASGEFFPPLFQQMVAVGETSGRVGQTYRQLALHYDRVLAARREFWGRMGWPLFQFVSAILVVGLLIWILGIVPVNSGRDGVTYDPLGFGLIGTRGLIIYANIVILGAIGLLLIWMSAARGARWVRAIHRIALDLPILGPALRTVALARFTWALELVIETPMDLRKALPLALEATGHDTYARHAPAVARDVGAGRTIFAALAATGEFPPELLDAIHVGEESGSLAEVMHRQSAEYQTRATSAMSVLAQLAGYLLWALIAALIVVLIFRLFSSYVGTIQSLTGPNALK